METINYNGTTICILNDNDMLTNKRVHRVFPEAAVKAKAMQANGINTNASKSDKAIIARVVEEMFDESNDWLNESA